MLFHRKRRHLIARSAAGFIIGAAAGAVTAAVTFSAGALLGAVAVELIPDMRSTIREDVIPSVKNGFSSVREKLTPGRKKSGKKKTGSSGYTDNSIPLDEYLNSREAFAGSEDFEDEDCFS